MRHENPLADKKIRKLGEEKNYRFVSRENSALNRLMFMSKIILKPT